MRCVVEFWVENHCRQCEKCSLKLGGRNPGGKSYDNSLNHYQYDGKNGTGGLLIIYANEYNSTGTISASGQDAVCAYNQYKGCGGSSGGGSINIFYNLLTASGTVNANAGACSSNPARGGNGTANAGSIASGTYVAN